MEEKETNINELEQLRQFKKKSRWSYEKIGKRMGVSPDNSFLDNREAQSFEDGEGKNTTVPG